MSNPVLDKVGAAEVLLARRAARASLAGFAAYVQPEDQQPASHHKLILAGLDAVLNGECSGLIITMPPGSAKSTYSSVVLPAYFLGKNPQLNIIAASHTLTLAERFGRRSRNLLMSDAVQALWPTTKVASDSSAAGRWSTNEGGEYLAAGIGGAITGFRADLGLIDDPVKSREEADSEVVREKTWDWFVNDFRTRLKPGARVVILMTRWHEDDLAGRLLDREPGKWKVLRLRMEAVADERDPLGRQPGERLWPEWFTEEMVTDAKRDPRTWSALYQQDPRPKEGSEFKRTWVQRYESPPKRSNRIILVDPASGEEGAKRTKRGHDYTSMWVVALGADRNGYVLDYVRDRLNLTERVDTLFELHRKYRAVEVRYERYGMMADVQAIRAEMERRDYRFRVKEVGGITPKNDRIRRLVPWFENGLLWFPQHVWYERDGKRVDLLAEFFDTEYAAFPYGAFDDGLDGLSRLGEPKMPLPWPKEDEVPMLESFGVIDELTNY